MNKTHTNPQEEMGIRFLLFRKALKKNRAQLASELGSHQEEIAAIERGKVFPKINYLHYLNREYGLNINWMVCEAEDMFIKDHPQDVDPNYLVKPSIPMDDPLERKKYLEFIQLMQIPVIEEAILAKLKEIKELLQEDP